MTLGHLDKIKNFERGVVTALDMEVRAPPATRRSFAACAALAFLAAASVGFASLFGWAYTSWRHAVHCDDLVASGTWISAAEYANNSYPTHFLSVEGVHYTGEDSGHMCHEHWTNVHKSVTNQRRSLKGFEPIAYLMSHGSHLNNMPCVQPQQNDNCVIYAETYPQKLYYFYTGGTNQKWTKTDTPSNIKNLIGCPDSVVDMLSLCKDVTCTYPNGTGFYCASDRR